MPSPCSCLLKLKNISFCQRALWSYIALLQWGFVEFWLVWFSVGKFIFMFVINITGNKISDASVLLCDVHRNRAWDRWTKTKENTHGQGKETMQWLMRLGQAKSPEAFETVLCEFQQSALWTNKVQRYMNNIWLPHKMVLLLFLFFWNTCTCKHFLRGRGWES